MRKLSALFTILPLVIATAMSAHAYEGATGIIASKSDSTITLRVFGRETSPFYILPGLRPLIGNKGDSVSVALKSESGRGSYTVAYVKRRVEGTVTRAWRNLREDWHLVSSQGINQALFLTWADSTVQSIGDPSEWIGRKVDWEEVWITVPEKGEYYLGYIVK